MTPCLRFKDGFRYDVWTPGGAHLLATLDGLAFHLNHDVTLTAGTNAHQPPDVHALGLAFDVSVRDWTVAQIVEAKAFLKMTLGDAFTVLYEVPTKPSIPALVQIAYINAGASAPHFHVQTRLGTIYPPQDVPGVPV